MRNILMLSLALLATPALAAKPAADEALRVTQFKWLSGCWGFDTADGVYEEQWTTPTGNSMQGLSRRIGEGYTREYDFMRLVTSGGGGFDFVSQQYGGDESRYNSSSVAANRVVFENPERPFPRKISYEYAAPDKLTMRLEGTSDGRPMGLSFPMKRKSCP
ncbi:MAG TPA: DUF6265 family protein [Solimonas sp.]